MSRESETKSVPVKTRSLEGPNRKILGKKLESQV
jgi:hypothetical protein